MSRVLIQMSMSLDGYVAGPNDSEVSRLHEWAFSEDEVGRKVLAESQNTVGASIAGRRTYDLSIPWWGPDGPGGSSRTPTFIVSHTEAQEMHEGGVYTFVDGPIRALELATAAAGKKDVDVFSASIGQQLLGAGRVDEIHVHLVPVLLGGGTRLFEKIGDDQIHLALIGVEEGSKATHLRYAVMAGK